MKIWIHKYSLQARQNLNAQHAQDANSQLQHEGLLFQIHFPDGPVGFSSLHFHPSLGDQTRAKFLDQLLMGGRSYLLKYYPQVILNASVDSKGQWKELLHHSNVISHWTSVTPLISDVELKRIQELGFKRIKIKVGATSHRLSEISAYYKNSEEACNLEWILDFNFSGSEPELRDFQKNLFSKSIFLEDPVPFDVPIWTSLIDFGFKLIADQVQPESVVQSRLEVSALAAKPSKIDMLRLLDTTNDLPILVTSNMGEDLDIFTSCYWASYIQKEAPQRFFGAGYLTHEFYVDSVYTEGARQAFPEPKAQMNWSAEIAAGWGRLDFLKSLDWTEV